MDLQIWADIFAIVGGLLVLWGAIFKFIPLVWNSVRLSARQSSTEEALRSTTSIALALKVADDVNQKKIAALEAQVKSLETQIVTLNRVVATVQIEAQVKIDAANKQAQESMDRILELESLLHLRSHTP